MHRFANELWGRAANWTALLTRYRALLLGEEHVRVVPSLRPEEIRHDIAVVAPGEVLVRSVADVRDVVTFTHVGERDDRIELRQGVDPRGMPGWSPSTLPG